jgi:phosphoribosyl 1,2-cyclic phosphodiesterase
MRVTVCGVRGSTPAPGADFVRVGGHTSCVAIAHDGAVPTLVLDAGTGIRRVTGLLGGGPFRGSILLGHLHWDHTQGLPFFRAADRPDSVVRVYIPAQGDTEEVLGRFMSPPHFPVPPGTLRGTWSFSGLDPGEHEIEGFKVLALEIPHKGGRAFGYRVSDGRSIVTYMSDHCPTVAGPGPGGLGEYHDTAMALTTGADLLFHDAQYLDSELPERASFGHSAIGYAVGLAEKAGVKRLLLFHHDPERTDDEVDAIAAEYASAVVEVDIARETMVIDIPRSAPA